MKKTILFLSILVSASYTLPTMNPIEKGVADAVGWTFGLITNHIEKREKHACKAVRIALELPGEPGFWRKQPYPLHCNELRNELQSVYDTMCATHNTFNQTLNKVYGATHSKSIFESSKSRARKRVKQIRDILELSELDPSTIETNSDALTETEFALVKEKIKNDLTLLNIILKRAAL